MPSMDMIQMGVGRQVRLPGPGVRQGAQTAFPSQGTAGGASLVEQVRGGGAGNDVAEVTGQESGGAAGMKQPPSLDVIRKNLKLSIYEPTGDMYAKIINADTGEVVKTIPPEALLRTWARMEEYVGMLLDDKA
ncbi:MAG: flagellar protein FlaG [Planctomycetes bacterium]|nr:flagellar protein FlaG [Planctomycetota bacterium]